VIYVLFHYLGLPEPAPWLAMTIAIGSIYAVIIGGMILAVRADARTRTLHKNRDLMRQVYDRYNRWKETETAFMELVRPALLKYQEALFRRDGKTYDDLRWTLGWDSITLIAAQKDTPAPYFEAQTRRLTIPTKYFDAPFDVLYAIEGLVDEHKDESDEDHARAAALARENECENCHGDGEAPVRGVRSPTGYDTCMHCGGTGQKP